MKRLANTAFLMLLLTVFGVAGARAADSSFMVKNDSNKPVMVSILWSGGNIPEFKLGPGESKSGADVTVPAANGSVKMQVTGDCKEGDQTFNPQRVTQAIIHCKDNAFMIKLGSNPKQ
ncbi:MAG TPA: hypothetical protein VIE43_19495 [Thermoanaerobaculia bacterium]|jgi:hypothetical protein|nr:hypothetical protein [Thermoanaerobaculia bacterium]